MCKLYWKLFHSRFIQTASAAFKPSCLNPSHTVVKEKSDRLKKEKSSTGAACWRLNTVVKLWPRCPYQSSQTSASLPSPGVTAFTQHQRSAHAGSCGCHGFSPENSAVAPSARHDGARKDLYSCERRAQEQLHTITVMTTLVVLLPSAQTGSVFEAKMTLHWQTHTHALAHWLETDLFELPCSLLDDHDLLGWFFFLCKNDIMDLRRKQKSMVKNKTKH